jgi:GT2 family glycosyltransferase
LNERVVAVVPVHNGAQETLAMLESVAASECPDLPVIVVDDGSTDRSAELIRERFPAVTILAGDGSLWWAGATNLGIREALHRGAEYILTMNNDNVVTGGFLSPLMDALRTLPRSIVTSQLRSLADPDFICSSGGVIDWWHGEIRDRTSRRDKIDVDSQPQWVHASSTLYPAALFREIGLFDNRSFPQYHGDADLSLRAAAAGYRLLVEPRSMVYRRTAVSGGVTMIDTAGFWNNVLSIRSLFYFRANYRFYAAHCPWNPFQFFLLIRYVRLLYSLLRKRSGS